MKKYFVILMILLLLSMTVVMSLAVAQAQQYPISAQLREIPGSIAPDQRGSNIFINDAPTFIVLTGNMTGESHGLCNGVFHADGTGNVHCTLLFEGDILGRAGTVVQNINGTFNAFNTPQWTGNISLSHGTGELTQIAANNLTYEQTLLEGTVQGYVTFPQG